MVPKQVRRTQPSSKKALFDDERYIERPGATSDGPLAPKTSALGPSSSDVPLQFSDIPLELTRDLDDPSDPIGYFVAYSPPTRR